MSESEAQSKPQTNFAMSLVSIAGFVLLALGAGLAVNGMIQSWSAGAYTMPIIAVVIGAILVAVWFFMRKK